MANDDDDDFPRYSEPAGPEQDYIPARAQPAKRMSAAEFERAGGRYEEQQQQPQPGNPPRMSAQEFEQAGGKYEEEAPSGIGSAVRGFLHGVAPMGAAVLTGAGFGTAIGGLPGTIVGGLAGLVSGASAGYLQEKAVEAVAPAEAEAYRKAREEHPYLTLGGELAAAGPYFGVRAAGTAAQKLLTRGLAGSAGAGIDAAQQLAIEHKFDPLRTLEAGAGSALLAGRPTRLGRALGIPGEHVTAPVAEAPAVRPAEAAEPPARAYPPATATEPHTAVTEIPDVYQREQYPREEWTGDKYGTREDYGARLEREFPQVKPELHGTPGPETDTPTAQAPKPAAEPAATEFAGVRAAKPGPEDYGKKTATGEGGAGVNVGDVDPTLAHAIEQKAPPPAPEEATAVPPRALEGEVFAPGEQIPEFPRSPTAAETAQTPPTPSHPRLQEAVARVNAAKQKAAGRPAEVLRGPELDPKLANRMLNQPAVLRSEAAKRGITPEILKAQAREAIATPRQQQQQQQPYQEIPSAPEQLPVRATSPPLQPHEPVPPLSPELARKVELYQRIGAEGMREQVATGERATAERQANMRQLMAERGYTPEQIDAMTPVQHYSALIHGDLPAPPGPQMAAQTRTPSSRQPAVVAEKAPPLVAATESDKAQGLLASLRRNLFSTVMGPSASAEAGQAAVRAAVGPLAQVKEKAVTRFTNELHQVANEMQTSPELFNKFTDAYETGRIGSLPDRQKPLAKALQRGYSDFWTEIKKLPKADQMEETRNYLTHMYDNKNGAVDKFVGEWFSPGAGSLQKRKYPTFADARAAGLTPLSNNPIEHFSRYADGISRYLAKQRIIEDLKGQGRFAYFKPETVGASGSPSPQVKGRPPEGWAEMPWAAQQFGRQAFAPRDVAETLNQFYSKGLSGGSFKDAYEAARYLKNTWTAAELGLSAYHATTMGVEAANAGNARALQMANMGDVIGAAKQLAKSLTVFPETLGSYSYGRELRKSYREQDVGGRGGLPGLLDRVGQQLYGERVQSPEVQKIMGALAKANIQPGNLAVTREYDMSKLGNLWDASKRGSLMHELSSSFSAQAIKDSYGLSLPKGGLDLVRRSMQTISKPLFQHFIPELKLGSMMKDMEVWMRANPNATDSQLVRAARMVADSTDNRMGEMNYNNMFINKAAKEIGILGLRSFGFTVGGPIREIGGGLASGISGVAQRQNRLDPRSEHWDPRAAYALAFLPTIAAISGAYQYLRTGKGPEDWRDLVTPQTGGMITSAKQKVPERILVPGYHKDFLGYFVNPKGIPGELHAKLAAPWTTLLEQLTGEDWRDKPYVPPRATTAEWLQAHGKAALSHMIPIGPKQLFEGAKEGSALTIPEQLVGVKTPGAYMLNPKGSEAYRTRQQQQDWRRQEKQEKLPPRPLPPSPYR